MVVGVARPHATVSVPREEATVLLAMDTSRSMKATDVNPTRLGSATAAAKAFLQKVPQTFRVGVVSFASRAVVAVPPTDDRSLVEAALSSLRAGEGTALGDAVSLSVRLGQRERASDGTVPPTAVLLISDDLDEILSLSDRIAVIYRGRISKALARKEVNIKELGLMMAGHGFGEGEAHAA